MQTLAAPVAFHPFDRLDGKVHAHELLNPGFALLIARKNCRVQLEEAIHARVGIPLPQGPKCIRAGDIVIVSATPGAWLCFKENGGYSWAAELAGVTHGLASVSDQSSGFCVVRMAGEKSREVLQMGVYLDLHPDVFAAGSAAMTDIAHISVLVTWPRADGPYYLAIPRSYAGSFRHWLESAAGG